MMDKMQTALNISEAQRQSISDLADGRLGGSAFVEAVELVAANHEGQEVWQQYHLIGDVLRGLDSTPVDSKMDFVSGFRAKLALEPVLPHPVLVKDGASPGALIGKTPTSANDGNFRWRMVAAMASLTAVLVVGWHMVDGLQPANGARLAGLTNASKDQTVVAKTPQELASDKTPQIMLRDPHLDSLMAAHKQFGGTSALQMPAGFIRNATFESDAK